MSTDNKQKINRFRILKNEKYKLKGVVIEYSTENELYEVIKKINPDIRILGSDWEGKEYTGKDLNIPIHWHKRDHEYSTSNLRKRVFQAELKKRDSK